MKTKAALAIFGLLLGYLATSLFSDDSPDLDLRQSRPDSPPTQTDSPSQTVVPSERASSSSPKLDRLALEETLQTPNKWAEERQIKERIRSKAALKFLTTKLNLDEEQTRLLQDYFEKNLALIDEENLMATFEGTKLDQIMAENLSPAQTEAYQELKARKQADQIDASSLRKLDQLDFLDLNQDQKDAVYDQFYNDAVSSSDNDGNPTRLFPPISRFDSLKRIDPTLYPSPGETADARTARLQRRQENLDRRLEMLRPVLDEAQFSRYRNYLEKR